MAYVPQKEEDIDNERQMDPFGPQGDVNQQTTQGGQQVTTSGQSSTISGGSQKRKPRTRDTQKSGRGSGMHTNFQKYIEANKPALQNLSKKITQKATTEAGRIGEQIQERQNELEQDIKRAASRQEQDVGRAKQYVGNVAQTGQLDQPIEEGFGQKQLQQMLSGERTYDVNRNLESADLSRQAQNIAQAYDPRDKQQSVGRLLGRTFEGDENQYTAGERSFDTALLSGDPSRLQNVFQTGRQAAQTAEEQVQQARRQAIQSLAGRRLAAQEVPEQLYSFGDEQQAGIRGEVEQEVSDIRSRLQDYDKFLQTGEGADQFITPEAVQEYQQLRESLGTKLQDLGGRAQEMMGISNVVNITQDDPMTREQATTNRILELSREELGLDVDNVIEAINAVGLDRMIEIEQQAAQDVEAMTEEDLMAGSRDVIRVEQLPQLLNEIGRVTDQISTEELRTMGMTRQDLTDMIVNNVIKGRSAGTVANLSELERRLTWLGEQAILGDEEAYRQSLLETFAPQRTVDGDVVTNTTQDFSELFDITDIDSVTEANVADAKQRARLDAVRKLMGGRGEAFEAREDGQELIDEQNILSDFDPVLAARRTAGADVLSDQELEARRKALQNLSGNWRWQL